jgi:hypothetical protein
MRRMRRIWPIGILFSAVVLAGLGYQFQRAVRMNPTPVSLAQRPGERQKSTILLSGNAVLATDIRFSGDVRDAFFDIIAGNTEIDCRGHSIIGTAREGISAQWKSGIHIRDCVIEGVDYGLAMKNISGLKIEKCRVRARRAGIQVINSTGIELTEIEAGPLSGVFRDSSGFNFLKSSRIQVRRCIVRDMPQGILFYGSSDFEVSENRIERMYETGIGTFHDADFTGCDNGRIVGNVVEQALYGVEIFAGSSDILVKGNTFTRCAMGVRVNDNRSVERILPVKNIRLAGNTLIGGSQMVNLTIENPEAVSMDGNVERSE